MMQRNCDTKRIYNNKGALLALSAYRSAILFSSMDHYYCSGHSGYHLGHNKRLGNKKILSLYGMQNDKEKEN
tara:strand:- start:338 stop:553 length:216 start_codon:yes stop_codon:yes gene_type:complete